VILFRDRGRERRGDTRIDGVTARAQDAHSGLDHKVVAAAHHLMQRADLGEHGLGGTAALRPRGFRKIGRGRGIGLRGGLRGERQGKSSSSQKQCGKRLHENLPSFHFGSRIFNHSQMPRHTLSS
jgi:hypothetical protein